MRRFDASRDLRDRFHEVIPGGGHTYAKGDDQYPETASPFITHGEGCHVWDVDGNEFIEYGMGLRAVTLGHAFPSVVEAACKQMKLGSNFTRPAILELESAERLLEFVGADGMVKFAKNGSDVTTAAIRLARAYTGRDLVAVCDDQPFFSTDDWFIGHTQMDAGVPEAIRDLTVGFRYNNLASVRELFSAYPKRISCLVLEAETSVPPEEGFLLGLRQLCDEEGALLIFDEMITGFRWQCGSAQRLHGVTPDLSAFGKGMGNGFAVSALVGAREVMQLGGIRHNSPRVFLLSTTHGAEQHSLAAALEVMRTYREEPVIEHLYKQGGRLADGIQAITHSLDMEGFFGTVGKPCNLVYFTRDQEKKPSQSFRTLFLQEIIRRGVLAPSFVVSYSHTDADIDSTLERVGEALTVYKKALEDGIDNYLVGRPVQPVMRRWNSPNSYSGK